MRVDRQLGAERAQDVDLRRRVRDVVVAADHVRDPVEHVVDGRGEVVDGAAVGADDDRVGEVLVRELAIRGGAAGAPVYSIALFGDDDRWGSLNILVAPLWSADGELLGALAFDCRAGN